MDLRVLVVTEDLGLSELVRAQAENLGCACSVVDTYDLAAASLDWADAAVIDLVGAGLDALHRLRVEAPRLRVAAIAPSEELAAEAREAGAERILLEPFTIPDVIEAVRSLGPTPAGPSVIDLRTGEGVAAPVVDDAPWWATR
ncbi:MAG: hypothetical protein ACSLFP_11630 [Acidimicrobiales bacterium]